jgi:ribosomal protein S18 acetylase RimI-like enzyme
MAQENAITIRPLEADDRGRWAELLAAHGRVYGRTLGPATLDIVWGWLAEPGATLKALVAVDAAAGVVGIVHYQPAYRSLAGSLSCQLSDLHVAAAWRGRGIGRRLIEDVRAAARDEGFAVLRWLARESNHAARELYDSLDARTDFVQYELPLNDVSLRRNRPPTPRERRRA